MAHRKLINPDNLPGNNPDVPIVAPAPVAHGIEKHRKRNLSYEIRNIVNDLFFNVIIPSTKGMLYEFLKDGWNQVTGQLIFGKTPQQPGRSRGLPGHNYYSYDSQYSPNLRRGRALQPYYGGEIAFNPRSNPIGNDIFYPTETDARIVLAGLLDRVAEFRKVSLGDLRFLSGLEAGTVHQQYGWTDLTGTEVVPTPDGWLLTLPPFQYTKLRR